MQGFFILPNFFDCRIILICTLESEKNQKIIYPIFFEID